MAYGVPRGLRYCGNRMKALGLLAGFTTSLWLGGCGRYAAMPEEYVRSNLPSAARAEKPEDDLPATYAAEESVLPGRKVLVTVRDHDDDGKPDLLAMDEQGGKIAYLTRGDKDVKSGWLTDIKGDVGVLLFDLGEGGEISIEEVFPEYADLGRFFEGRIPSGREDVIINHISPVIGMTRQGTIQGKNAYSVYGVGCMAAIGNFDEDKYMDLFIREGEAGEERIGLFMGKGKPICFVVTEADSSKAGGITDDGVQPPVLEPGGKKAP